MRGTRIIKVTKWLEFTMILAHSFFAMNNAHEASGRMTHTITDHGILRAHRATTKKDKVPPPVAARDDETLANETVNNNRNYMHLREKNGR